MEVCILPFSNSFLKNLNTAKQIGQVWRIAKWEFLGLRRRLGTPLSAVDVVVGIVDVPKI